MHLVRVRRQGIPQDRREAFDMLERAGIIVAALSRRLKKVVGSRVLLRM